VRAHTVGIKRARTHRRSLTGAEVGLWVRLKGRKLDGYHFRRQHPVGPYILDFYCAEARLAIELDGYSHEVGGAPAYDARRDAWLLARGIETLRIGPEFSKNPDGVAGLVLAEVQRRAPSVTA
jgi:very-short-patch-repair endonuclease